MTITPATLATDLANQAALDWVDAIIASQQRALRELESYRERLTRAIAEDDTPDAVVSWIVNEVQNAQRAPRLDMAPRIATDLAVARHLRQTEGNQPA